MHKLLLFALLAVGIGTAQAEVVIELRPPKVLVEHRGFRPRRIMYRFPAITAGTGVLAWPPGSGKRGRVRVLYG